MNNETNKNTFEQLNVNPEIVKVLKREGIVNPTSIQEKTIPLIYQGKDLIGISRTGSGKTASFGIPLLEKVKRGEGTQALILAPTRELANQISVELRKWSKPLNLSTATIFGGVSLDPQIKALAKSEIVVGTPGRILDHLNRRNLNLTRISIFVLDEADKMIEMGFIEDIEQIMFPMPHDRQILLFGATISNEIDYLKKKYMNNVAIAEAELHVKKDLLKQSYYNVRVNEKFSLLVHLLKKEHTGRVMIFCSKRSTVELVNSNLRTHGIKSEMIHGKMTQNKRLQVIERFNNDKVDYLVASAVAARGLDIKDVTHVFNYDLSRDPQEYIHRVGRTARAGEAGEAITLLSRQDYEAFSAILGRYKVDVEEMSAENFAKLKFETMIPQQRGRFSGNRGYNRGHSRAHQGRGSYGRGSSNNGRSNSYGNGSRQGNSGQSNFRSNSSSNNRSGLRSRAPRRNFADKSSFN